MNDKVHCGPFLPQPRQLGALGWGAYGLNQDGSTDDHRDNHVKAAPMMTADQVGSKATTACNGGTTMLDRSLLTGIDAIDLTMVQKKLLDPDEGEGHRLGWTVTYCAQVVEEYRRYLALARRYPDQTLVPSHAVDKVWHMHILDTLAYATDCERVFGYFLHHFPYLGMRGEQDQAEHISYRDRTLELYRGHFGEPPPEIWDLKARPPKCGAPQRPHVNSVEGIQVSPPKCGAPGLVTGLVTGVDARPPKCGAPAVTSSALGTGLAQCSAPAARPPKGAGPAGPVTAALDARPSKCGAPSI